MSTVFSTGYAFYKLIKWLHELKVRLSVSIKLCDNIKRPFSFPLHFLVFGTRSTRVVEQ